MPFTPGPWKLDSQDTYIFGPKMEMVAMVRGTGEGLPEHENGLLLAAAPDLYEACKAVIKYFGEWRDSTQDHGECSLDDIMLTMAEDASTITECIDRARAALVKAESK